MLDYDFIIVGGGATGSALALMLAPLKKRVLLVEAQAQKQQAHAPHFDERAIALSYGSQRIFEQLNVWSLLAPEATPIQSIHVSDRGQFGHAMLHAESMQVPALGQVIPLRVLNSVLYERVGSTQAAAVLAPAKVIDYQHHADHIALSIEVDGVIKTLRTAALLAADGAHSSLRQQAGISVKIDHYDQVGLIANIQSDRADFSFAYERFTHTGPLALLPLTNQRWSLVWSLNSERAAHLQHCEEPEFLSELQTAFGWRVGKFTRVGERQAFPLQRIVSSWRQQGRLLLLGNAAQQVHPIAGQGFNLSLRDAQALAEHLRLQPWSPDLVQQFLNSRQADQRQVLNNTDQLARLFSNNYPVLSPLRALALDVMSICPALQQSLARQAMGL